MRLTATCAATSGAGAGAARGGQGRADIARRVIHRMINPPCLSEMAPYDVASNISPVGLPLGL
jgi:hypothetical protein